MSYNGSGLTLVNPLISIALAAFLFLVWLRTRPRTYVLPAAASFFLCGLGFFLQQTALPLPQGVTRSLSNLSLVLGIALVVVTVAVRYGKPIPKTTVLAIAGVGLLSVGWFSFGDESVIWRVRLMNITGAALFLVAAMQIGKRDRLLPVDTAIFAMLLANVGVLLVRVLLLTQVSGAANTALVDVPYMTASTVVRGVLSIGLAVAVATAVHLDERRRAVA